MSQQAGKGHLEAWLRAGGKEAAQALIAFPNQPIQLIEEPGLFGNATQMEVNAERGNSMSYDQYLESKALVREQPAPELQSGRER
jgi:hypothetical protein